MKLKIMSSPPAVVTYPDSAAAAQLTLHDNPYQVSASHDPETSMEVVIAVDIADALIFGAFLGPVILEF